MNPNIKVVGNEGTSLLNIQKSPESRFEEVVKVLVHNSGVTCPTDGNNRRNRFGSNGLRIHNKIFAMLIRGNLVVKLPRERVDGLVESGEGNRFDPRHDGRLMKEWLALKPKSKVVWLNLAKEAMKFVATSR